MCGLAGVIRFDGQAIDPAVVAEMLRRLRHRGQDRCDIRIGSAHPRADAILSHDCEVALGHRRLSIIDLSDDASQPMPYDDGRLWLSFNGEIYNYIELREELRTAGYRFLTESDSEVILAAYREWGDACVRRFNGMFALVIWDNDTKRLFCARDQLGVKPFYFYRGDGYLAFASESQALRQFHGNRLDRDAIAAYLMSLYIPADWSVFAGVAKLPAAHSMTISATGAVRTVRYWQVTAVGDQPDTSASRMELTRRLELAVRRQLRSDVPVGALLSGGVDSAMIVALAARQEYALRTYSVGFEGHPVNELRAAAEIARRYGTEHREVMLDDGTSLAYLDTALRHLSEPIADPSVVPSYVLPSLAAEDGVKVLLSGTGGDEIFGGYDRYSGGESWKRRVLGHVPEGARVFAGRLMPNASKLGARLANPYLDMLFTTSGDFDLGAASLRGRDDVARFLGRLAAAFPAAVDHPSLLFRQMQFDLSVYLPDDILYLFDQMSMASTIEGRVPLLDVDVVELAFRFPPRSHVNRGRTKVLFRELAEPYLGREHVWRQKHGFTGPVSWWVNRNRAHFMSAAEGVADIPGFDGLDVRTRLRARSSGEIDDERAHAIFILYCLSRWFEHLTTES